MIFGVWRGPDVLDSRGFHVTPSEVLAGLIVPMKVDKCPLFDHILENDHLEYQVGKGRITVKWLP
jgi:hypothetical protein